MQTILEQLSGTLAPYMTGSIIGGGDFNCIVDLDLDQSHPPLLDAPIHRTARMFRNWQSQWGMVDTWRSPHPLDGEYSSPLLCT